MPQATTATSMPRQGEVFASGAGLVTDVRGRMPIDALAETYPPSRIPVVNVASVPQRSPLRYPGGKTWLVPHVREWLARSEVETLVEPFAGGGIVSLTAVMENLVSSAVMVEIDPDVAAFWQSAFANNGALIERLVKFKPTLESLGRLQSEPPTSVEEHGFRTLVLNRTRRGGILAPGASFAKHGENGKGVLSRWYPGTLAKRLTAIQQHASRFTFLEGDGLELLPSLLQDCRGKAAVFVDPPYTAKGGKRAGSRLYAHSEIDHPRLFEIMADSGADFLMTYDAAPEVVQLVQRHSFSAVRLAMKNCHHNQLPELVITPEAIFA